MVIVLTDGHSQVDPAEAAKKLADDRKTITFAVALVPTAFADRDELLSIANNDPNRVFTRVNLDQFEMVFKNYVSKSCPGIKEEDAGLNEKKLDKIELSFMQYDLIFRTSRPWTDRRSMQRKFGHFHRSHYKSFCRSNVRRRIRRRSKLCNNWAKQKSDYNQFDRQYLRHKENCNRRSYTWIHFQCHTYAPISPGCRNKSRSTFVRQLFRAER